MEYKLSNTIKDIHKYLRDDLLLMNQLIIASLAAKEELIGLVANYLMEAGGKRIRPLLTILSSKMFSYTGSNNIKLAAAIEFIHAATLLHDDVVDGGKMRRFKPTANTIWGNNVSILVGDFLFTQSFRLMVATESIPALQTLSRASAIIIEGEVAQLAKLNQKRIITLEEYYEIIEAKTAVLFGAACESGAIVANQPFEVCQDLRKFGINLGLIFQIIDDWLDYFGKEEDIGKHIGSDFFEGKATIPLILLYAEVQGEDKIKLEKLMQAEHRLQEDFAWVKELFCQHQPIKQNIINKLEQLKSEAKYLLIKIAPANECKDYMLGLLDFTMNRSY